MRYTWGGLISIGILFSIILIVTFAEEAQPEIIFLWGTITIIITSIIVFRSNID